jgi:hypothetical protein
MTTYESAAERYLVQRVDKIGGYVVKGGKTVPGPNYTVAIAPDIVFFVRVLSSADSRVDPTDRAVMAHLAGLGCYTSIICGKPAVDTFINGLTQVIAEKKAEDDGS